MPTNQPTDKRDELLRFVNQAFRNIDMPPLSDDDLADIDGALRQFASPPEHEGQSVCTSCNAIYPSAPLGHAHKCGACEDGLCRPLSPATPRVNAQASDVERVARIIDPGAFKTWTAQDGTICTALPCSQDDARRKAREILSALPAQPCDKLVEALTVYASPNFWNEKHPELDMSVAELDRGDRAREALSAWEKR